MRPDFLRRTTPTPLTAELCLAGRAIRIETDNPIILDSIRAALRDSGGAAPAHCDFLWRVVGEPDEGGEASWPEPGVFADGDLAVVNLGQRTFVAVDAQARHAVGFVEERVVEDKVQFGRVVLDPLISLTTQALDLKPSSAIYPDE